ncbi:MAG: GNAT family N-acetyltransferase [Burkholderiales bacterium]|nr:GNAT family N-acetyltransferase [Burkholderiales bacterium]
MVASAATDVAAVPSVGLRDFTTADLPLVARWLRDDRARSAWGDPDANLCMLREPACSGQWRAIVEAGGRAVGLMLWQNPTREELDLAGLGDIPTSVIDIDILIGEAGARGRGLGPAAIGLVAEAVLADPAVPLLIACASVDNRASQRAFAKAGFVALRIFDDVPQGPHWLLRRGRQAPACG